MIPIPGFLSLEEPMYQINDIYSDDDGEHGTSEPDAR